MRVRLIAFTILGLSLAGLLGGCNLLDAYDQAAQTEPSQPDGDVPSPTNPPIQPPPRIPAQPVQTRPRVTSQPPQQPTFLDRLHEQSKGRATGEYLLDERYKLYHRTGCPYAPTQKEAYDLQVSGTKLVHTKSRKSTATHMSREEIEAKRYEPCPHCRPDLDRPPQWYGGARPQYRERLGKPYRERQGDRGATSTRP